MKPWALALSYLVVASIGMFLGLLLMAILNCAKKNEEEEERHER